MMETVIDTIALFWLLTYLHPVTMWTFYAVLALIVTVLVTIIRRRA